MAVYSPLRYPGGKAKFTGLIHRCLAAHIDDDTVFVEPFCGGAGVALTLLATGAVKRIALNDLDPLVANFWRVVFGKTGKAPKDQKADFTWLLNQIDSADLTIKGWIEQKNLKPSSARAAAYKCLYLNRTSFNGILHQAGPIGGWEQKQRTVGVRFNQVKLIRRLNALWDLRESVADCTNETWQSVFNRYQGTNSFIYLDPPYFHRAEQLYKHLFDCTLHEEMRDILVAERDTPWLLSYDDAFEVRQLYEESDGVDGLVIDKTYSAHPLGGGRFLGRELFFSNRPLLAEIRRTIMDHSAVSVVGRVELVAPHMDGPIRVPLFGGVEERRKRGADTLN